jgi:hypothetical protein
VKVLFLHKNCHDYLSESVFHGLRSLLGENCLDVPRYDIMYKPLSEALRKTLRGNGFTLYGLLDEIPDLDYKRQTWKQNLSSFDIIILPNIWTCWDYLPLLLKTVPREKIIVMDGEDGTRLFPFRSVRDLAENLKMLSVSLKNIKYFKREWTQEQDDFEKMLSLFTPKLSLLPVSFGIPKEKITYVKVVDKQKLLNNHIVDKEVASHWKDAFYGELGKEAYLFTKEKDYYRDLQISKFGITTKRAGWDCMRHYELAANGAVLCFRELDTKPETSAPHDLNSSNCIIYQDYNHLMAQIENMSESQYEVFLQNTYNWIENYTTEKVAERLLNACF